MLVLSRKEGEELVIGDDIKLVVTRISGNRVTIGVDAPRDVKIYRGELFDQEKTSLSMQSESGNVDETASSAQTTS